MSADSTLRLHDSPIPQPGAPASAGPPGAALLIGAAEAGLLCGVSRATWWRLHAGGKVPAPVRLGGGTFWRAEELRDWIASGCPDRKTWEALRRQKGGGR
jgi:predicted DNA-binding transcriptional regulator AlpA